MSTANVQEIERVAETTSAFRILSDPTRYRMLCLLYKAEDGMCVYELAGAVGVSHSAASHQLSKLESRGVVAAFREGQTMCYRLRDTAFVSNLIRVMRAFDR